MKPAPDSQLPAQLFARALLTGDVGFKLFHALVEQFPTLPRPDVYLGAALAWTELAAGLLAAEAEIQDLRRQLEQRRVA